MRQTPAVNERMNQGRIGEMIRARRELLRRTQQDVADAAGIAKSRVSQIESGDGNAVKTLGQVAAALQARWLVYLIPADLPPERADLVERLVTLVARIEDRDVRHLSLMLDAYTDDLRLREQSRTSR